MKPVRTLYADFDSYCCEWLKNLMGQGALPRGTVSRADIKWMTPDDLMPWDTVHVFAGIGGWPYALELAGWPRDQPVWTGSCPCQPFSTAGKRRGIRDRRHLWPVWKRLISHRRPPVVFGEQVASKAGREWLDGVRSGLEALGYEFGAADLGAACIGAPHIRQRLFWVADRNTGGCQGTGRAKSTLPSGDEGYEDERSAAEEFRSDDGLAKPPRDGRRRRQDGTTGGSRCPPEAEGSSRLGDPHSGELEGRPLEPAREEQQAAAGAGSRPDIRMEQSDSPGSQQGREAASIARHGDPPDTAGAWDDGQYIACSDGKARRTQHGTFPLAHGLPRSMGPGSTRAERLRLGAAKAYYRGALKGYGNAIVPELAAEFVRAYMETRGIDVNPLKTRTSE